MNHALGAAAVALCVAISACSGDPDAPTISGDEHARDAGEESGTALSLNETFDSVRNGVRLVMSYDAEENSFNGTVKNTTGETLREVRVEVHLSNGKELGPTTPIDLDPAMERKVKLLATSRDFDAWTPHSEVGVGEHAGSDEGGEEHE